MFLPQLLSRAEKGEKLAVLTCYDASFARILADNGVDVLLVGDSLGMTIQGHATTLPVSIEHMAYHTQAVARGAAGKTFLVADLPFGSYQKNPEQAFDAAARLMAAGANMVKLEGGAVMAETVRFMVERGVPVCAHIGLTPQSVHALGGYRVQGRDEAGAARIKADARSLEDAGAALMVLEMVPSGLAAEITRSLQACATIGIGAGPDCDGQVLVLHDMLGIYPGRKGRFVRDFMAETQSIEGAVKAYVAAVKDGSFPGPEHCY